MSLMSATVHLPEGTIVGGHVLFLYIVNGEGRQKFQVSCVPQIFPS